MSEPFLGEIRMVGFNFAPRGWALCQGQLLSIAQNSALFSLLGTTYGGNGQTTFGLPDLRGRVPTGTGTGPGLSPITAGQIGGTPSTTLTQNQMPAHTHTVALGNPSGLVANIPSANSAATTQAPNGNIPAQSQQPGREPVAVDSYAAPEAADGHMAVAPVTGTPSLTVGIAGGSLPVNIQQPYVGINFAIALEGIFPSRN